LSLCYLDPKLNSKGVWRWAFWRCSCTRLSLCWGWKCSWQCW